MLYVESRKSFKVKREKINKIILPSARQIHTANIFLCRVLDNYTRQTYFFAECLSLPSVFFLVCRVSNIAECFCIVCWVHLFCRVFFSQHSAKGLFAECPRKYTRQTPRHSANNRFSIVKTLGKKKQSAKREFAECQNNTRQRGGLPSVKKHSAKK